MTKLTTERLEHYSALPTQPAEGDGCFKKGIFMYEVRRMARQLLAYEQAAQNPVAWGLFDASNGALYNYASSQRAAEQYRDHVHQSDDSLTVTIKPLYTEPQPAPILPKQPESEIPFGDLEPIEVTDDMVFAFHNQLSDSALGSDEFTDIKHGLCAALMNIPRPAQPVIPELRYGDNVLWFLNELADFDASDIDSDDFDVYGEDRNGMEGCATISITELAADAAKLLSAQPVSEPYKLKDAVADIRNSGVEIDADKIKAERDTLNSPVIPDGWVMVPQQIFLDASDIESICSQCGDGHKSGYGNFTDGLLWVGDIQCDNGTIMHGLHISSSDYQEEGGLTLAEFAAPAQESE